MCERQHEQQHKKEAKEKELDWKEMLKVLEEKKRRQFPEMFNQKRGK